MSAWQALKDLTLEEIDLEEEANSSDDNFSFEEVTLKVFLPLSPPLERECIMGTVDLTIPKAAIMSIPKMRL